jgi:hypothetical protein
MIINTSYFLNKNVFIPNAVVQPSIGANTPSAVDALKEEIEERERECLLMFLTESQYNELITQFEQVTPGTDWTFKASALQKWKDFVDGKPTDNWKGIRYTIGGKKVSLIAYYIFYHYLGSDFTTYTTTGVVASASANSTMVNPTDKQVKAWNQFVSMANGYCSNGHKYTHFDNWNGHGIYFASIQSNELNLYDFMQKNPDDYDTSKFIRQSVINSLGL